LRDENRVLEVRFLLHQGAQVVAVHAGQADVHHHHVRPVGLRQRNGIRTVVRQLIVMADHLDHPPRRLGQGLIVLDNQDA
jgi:hypothetical protein